MKQLSKLVFTSLCLSSFLLCSCGKSEAPTHHYSNEWSHNETSHWHACTDEGYEDLKKDEANHTFVDVVTPPTYEAGGYTTHTCSVCDYSYVDSETEKLVHHYSSEWSKNETNHWHACTDEGYENLKKDEANHTFVDVVTPPTYDAGGYTTHTCSVCNYSYVDSETEKLVHHYSSEWSHNETSHWHACTDEGYEDLKKDEASHVYDGDHDAICNTCGYERSLGDHAPETAWSHDTQHHWHACTHAGCELKFDYEEHDCKPTGYCETCKKSVQIKNIHLDYTFSGKHNESFGTLEPGTYYYDIDFADPEATYRMALSHKTNCYVSNESGSFDDPVEIGTDPDDTYILPKPFNEMIYFKIVIEKAQSYSINIWQFK